MEELYAWCVPAWFNRSILDHTWVTSYDNRVTKHQSIGDVIGNHDHYWFSWGSFHAAGGIPGNADGYLLNAPGSIAYARCLCESNADSNKHANARGTIQTYGVDGVCHQLSNQILWATATAGSPAMTVRQARGYWLSNALFGTYGLQHAAWAAKKAGCMNQAIGPTDHDPDEFNTHAMAALRGHASDEEISNFLSFRQGFMVDLARSASQRQLVTAESLNSQYNAFFRRAADMLGGENFERVFGVPADSDFSIVDPDIYKASQNDQTP